MTIRYDAYGNRDQAQETRDRWWQEEERARREQSSRRIAESAPISPETAFFFIKLLVLPIFLFFAVPFLPVYFFWNRVGGMGKAGLVLAGFVLWYPWIFAAGWGLTHWAGH